MDYKGTDIELTERIKAMYTRACPIQDSIQTKALLMGRMMPEYVNVSSVVTSQTTYHYQFQHFKASMKEHGSILNIRVRNTIVSLMSANHIEGKVLVEFLIKLDNIMPQWNKEIEELERQRKRKNKAWSDYMNAELWLKSDYDKNTRTERMPYIYYNSRAAYELMRNKDEAWEWQPNLDSIAKMLKSKGIVIDKVQWRTYCESLITTGIEKWHRRETLYAERMKGFARKRHLRTILTKKADVMVDMIKTRIGVELTHHIEDDERQPDLQNTFLAVFVVIYKQINVVARIPLADIDQYIENTEQAFTELLSLGKELKKLLKGKIYDVYTEFRHPDSIVLAYKTKPLTPRYYTIDGQPYEDDMKLNAVYGEPANILVDRINSIAKSNKMTFQYIFKI